MNLVDSSGWIEYFINGKNAEQFSKPIENTDKLIVPTIILLEVFKFLLREKDETIALKAISSMHLGNIIDLNVDIALRAAKISNQLKLPMADSIIIAMAKLYEAVIWTMDSDFKNIEGIKYFSK